MKVLDMESLEAHFVPHYDVAIFPPIGVANLVSS